MAAHLGQDFSRVRVHSDPVANLSAAAVGARAYAVGEHVVFGATEYAPKNDAGQRLLAHELAHVVQQRGGSSASLSPLRVADSDSALETQAERAADMAGSSRLDKAPELARKPTAPVTKLARKADPARVATMKPWAVLADPDYIDNNLRSMEFYTAEQAVLHYRDGASLTIGLVPRWIKPPFETVDYHTERTDHAIVINESSLQFVPRVRDLPATSNLPYRDLLLQFTQTVKFSVEANSGRIVPNHLNSITAPVLSRLLLDSERRYVEQVHDVSAGAVKMFTAMEVVVSLMLLRSMAGRTAPATRAPRLAAVAGRTVLNRTGTITIEMAVERGLVVEGRSLFGILRAIQTRFVAAAPKSLEGGMVVVRGAAESVNLEIGIATAGTIGKGFIELTNKGGVITRVLSTGEIVVSKGSDILLRLIP